MSAIRSFRGAATIATIAAFALGGCMPRRATTRIFAAASIAPACEAIFAGDATVTVQAAASSTLVRQLIAGADADVFVSANAEWIDVLERAGRVVPDSRRPFVSNELVLVRHPAAGSPGFGPVLERGDALGAALDGRLAIGDPAHVPAGRYAESALAALGLWDAVVDRLAPCADVRHALALVVRGECALGVVYRTDALAAADDVVIEAALRGGDVRYEACCISGDDPEPARRAMAKLFGAAGTAALSARGFRLAATEPR